MGQFENRSLLLLGLLVLCSSFLGINSGPLWNCLEAANGGVIREIVNSGNFIDLKIMGESAWQLSPLYYWLSSGIYYLLGDGAFSVRFWSPVASSATVMLFYLGVTNLFSETVGFCSALVLISSLLFTIFSKAAVVDTLFLLLLTWTILAYIYRKYWCMYLGWALSILTAGSLGLLLPGAIVLCHGLCFGSRGQWARLRGLGLVLLLVLPWYGGLYYYHGEEALAWAWNNYYYDGLVDYAYATAGWWHYLLLLAWGFFPWVGLALLAIKHAIYDGRIDDLRKLQPFLLWLVLGLAFLSWHGVKSPAAAILLLPPLAVLVGWDLARLKEKQGRLTTYKSWLLLSGLNFAIFICICLSWGRTQGGELVFISQMLAAMLGLIALTICYSLYHYRDLFLALWLHALAGLATMLVLFVFAMPLVAQNYNVAHLSDYYRHHCPFGSRLYVAQDLRQGHYYYSGRADYLLPQGELLEKVLADGSSKYFLVDGQGKQLLEKHCDVVQQMGDNYLLLQK